MSDLLLELYSNALPYSEQNQAEKGYYKIFSDSFQENNVIYEKIEVFSTPCRITIFVQGIQDKVKIEAEIIKGPKVGCDHKALEGFCRSQGVDDNNFLFKSLVGSTWYWIYRINEHYKDAQIILLDILPKLIFAYDWHDYLYSGLNQSIKWPRFLKNILCILDEKPLKLPINGLEVNNITFGHQFLSNKSQSVRNFKEYKQFLADNCVILAREDRKQKLINDANKLLKQNACKLELDEQLLDVIIGCFEYPSVMLSEFDEKYLKLPQKIIETVLKQHQRCFPVYQEKNNTLQNCFLYTTNSCTNNSEQVNKGYQNAITARFNDAEFLLEQDLNVSLDDRLIALKNITFHTKLGSIWDKSCRLVGLVKRVKLFYQESIENIEFIDFAKLKKAALYSKCDLTSLLVDEFGSLKGYMGYYFALQSGFDSEVAQYIKYQYSIKTADEDSNQYLYLCLLDSVDSLVGMYIAGEKVTGNYDRYGMRRLALKIIHTIRNMNVQLPFNLFALIEESEKQYYSNIIGIDKLADAYHVIDFIKLRHNNLLKLEKDYNVYIAESVFNSSLLIDNNYSINSIACAGYEIRMVDIHIKNISYLVSEKCHDMFEAFLLSFRRIDNIMSGKRIDKDKKFQNLSVELENLSHELEINLKNSLSIYQQKYPISWRTKSVINGGVLAFDNMCKEMLNVLHDVNLLLDMLRINDETNLKAIRRAKLVAIVLHELKKIADFSRLYNIKAINE